MTNIEPIMSTKFLIWDGACPDIHTCVQWLLDEEKDGKGKMSRQFELVIKLGSDII